MFGLGLGAAAGTLLGANAAFASAAGPVATAGADPDLIGDVLARAMGAGGPSGPTIAAGGRAVRRVALHNLHTDERFQDVYWQNGSYLPDALAEVNRVLRDYRTGDVHPIDRRLIDLLDDLSATTETTRPFQVISAYRSPLTNARMREHSGGVARNSLHMEGMALDIRSEAVSVQSLRKAAIGLGRGGVGYYPRSEFVHVDVGAVRTWQGA